MPDFPSRRPRDQSWRERQRRFRIATVLAPGIVGVALLVFRLMLPPEYFERNFATSTLTLSTLTAVLLVTPAFVALMLYLQGGFSLSSPRDTVPSYSSDSADTVERDVRRALRRLDETERQLAKLMTAAERAPSPIALKPYERNDLVAHLRAQLQHEALAVAVQELRGAVETQYRAELQFTELERQFGETLQRLNRELSVLGRRSNLNLTLGIFTTSAGLALLTYCVVGQSTPLAG